MKALIGMSGGVDSSVAALLTQKEGFACIGATMQLLPAQCHGTDNANDARKVAERMGMPFYVFPLAEEFQARVMDTFAECYLSGLTPNPCVACNRHLKFGVFLQKAAELGCEYIVTGHYARIAERNGRYCLQKAADEGKDQTYFLYTLTQEQLRHSRFPLGALTKAEARQLAEEHGFVTAKKKDSQDICFIPDGDYMAFLERHTGKKGVPGKFLDESGKTVGIHRGAAAYTLGQRKGLGLAMGEPVYVLSKDMAANTVTVGPNAALYRTGLIAEDCNWMAIASPAEPVRCKAKARSRMTEQWATVTPLDGGRVRVEFDAPQRAITPGQAVVFYEDDIVLGGGTITEVL